MSNYDRDLHYKLQKINAVEARLTSHEKTTRIVLGLVLFVIVVVCALLIGQIMGI